jgi:hypothetical protein
MTVKEVKLVTYLIHQLIVTNSIDDNTDISRAFLENFVLNKIRSILKKPLKESLESIYYEVQANKMINNKEFVGSDEFMKTMNDILKQTLLD